MDFETRAIHDGSEPDPSTGAVIPPVYLTSTYVQDEVGKHRGYEYSRTHNPTRTALQKALASLESGRHGLAFASGLGAATTLLLTLKPGDRLVLSSDVYGGTWRLAARVFGPWGLELVACDLSRPGAIDEVVPAAMVWIETPTNPLLRVVDIGPVAATAKAAGAAVVVDNTFATPYYQRPLELGADVVLHSTTKYLAGHSDVVGGALVFDDEALYERLLFLQNAVGAVPGPLDCFLVHRGLKTLALRMQKHTANATEVAAWLGRRSDVAEVFYPGFGGMVSFRPTGGVERALNLVARTRLFALAESLGGVESLIEVPHAMTHASVAGTAAEVPDDLIRLSVGIEAAADLIADLEQALE